MNSLDRKLDRLAKQIAAAKAPILGRIEYGITEMTAEPKKTLPYRTLSDMGQQFVAAKEDREFKAARLIAQQKSAMPDLASTYSLTASIANGIARSAYGRSNGIAKAREICFSPWIWFP